MISSRWSTGQSKEPWSFHHVNCWCVPYMYVCTCVCNTSAQGDARSTWGLGLIKVKQGFCTILIPAGSLSNTPTLASFIQHCHWPESCSFLTFLSPPLSLFLSFPLFHSLCLDFSSISVSECAIQNDFQGSLGLLMWQSSRATEQTLYQYFLKSYSQHSPPFFHLGVWKKERLTFFFSL